MNSDNLIGLDNGCSLNLGNWVCFCLFGFIYIFHVYMYDVFSEGYMPSSVRVRMPVFALVIGKWTALRIGFMLE